MTDEIWSHKIKFFSATEGFLDFPNVKVLEPSELEEAEQTISMLDNLRLQFPGVIGSGQVEEVKKTIEHEMVEYHSDVGSLDSKYKELIESRKALESDNNQNEEGAIVSSFIEDFRKSRPAQFGVNAPVNSLVSYASKVPETSRFYSRDNFEIPAEGDMALVRASEDSSAPFWLCKVVSLVSDSKFIVQWYDNDNDNINGIYTARKKSLKKRGGKKNLVAYTQELELESFICWSFEWNSKSRKINSVVIDYALRYLKEA